LMTTSPITSFRAPIPVDSSVAAVNPHSDIRDQKLFEPKFRAKSKLNLAEKNYKFHFRQEIKNVFTTHFHLSNFPRKFWLK